MYAYKFHTKYHKSGPLWRDRFKSLLIENESYLHACGQYIENNPVRAELVLQGEQWEYSSSRHYLGKIKNGLVDQYEGNLLPSLPNDINLDDERYFEEEIGIGSDFFRFQMEDRLKRKKIA
jgi:hypothetical protein